MALTPDERALLDRQRADMMTASAKADVYAAALRMYEDTPPPSWWRWILRSRRRRGMAHAQRLHRSWDAEARRLAGVLRTWVAVHEVLGGSSRGPVISGTEPLQRGPWL